MFEYNNNIYVSFRGTSSFTQLKKDMDAFGGDINNIIKKLEKNINEKSEGLLLLKHLINKDNKNNAIIFPGFAKTLFTSLQVINLCLVKLIEINKNEKANIYITGHSLGGALATLYGFSCAYGIFHNVGVFKNKEVKNKVDLPINVCSLGSPKIGNSIFTKIYTDFIDINYIKLDRVVSKSKLTGLIDSASQYPPAIYKHSGFKNEKKIDCDIIVNELVTELHKIGFTNEEDKKSYKDQIIKHCRKDTNFPETHKLEHVGEPIIKFTTIEETKNMNKQCKSPIGTLCHGYYYNISFMHLATRMLSNTPAFKLFKINNSQTGLGLMNDNTLSFMVTSDINISNAKKSIKENNLVGNKCKNKSNNKQPSILSECIIL